MNTFEPVDSDYKIRIKESFKRQPFMDFIGAELFEVQPGFCEIHLAYKKELSQQHGFFHGGIIGTLADNSGGYAAYTLMPADSSILTVEYKLNIIAPGDGELLIGRGQVISSGKTLKICRTEVFVRKNNIEKLCAAALVTLMTMIGKADKPL